MAPANRKTEVIRNRKTEVTRKTPEQREARAETIERRTTIKKNAQSDKLVTYAGFLIGGTVILLISMIIFREFNKKPQPMSPVDEAPADTATPTLPPIVKPTPPPTDSSTTLPTDATTASTDPKKEEPKKPAPPANTGDPLTQPPVGIELLSVDFQNSTRLLVNDLIREDFAPAELQDIKKKLVDQGIKSVPMLLDRMRELNADEESGRIQIQLLQQALTKITGQGIKPTDNLNISPMQDSPGKIRAKMREWLKWWNNEFPNRKAELEAK